MITTLEKAPSYSGGDFLPPSAGVHDLGSTSLEWDNIFFGDDGGVYLGLDQDGGLYHKAASIAADEEITGVIEGTSKVLATAANSIYLFNITNDGDVHIVVSKAGNSYTAFLADGSTGDTIVNAATGQSVDVHIDTTKEYDFSATVLNVLGNDIDMGTTGARIDFDTDNDTSIRASADDVLMFELGASDRLQYGVAAFAFQEATEISTTAGDLTLNPSGNIALSANNVTGAGDYLTNSSDGPALVDESPSSTNPTLIPDRTDLDTGIGQSGPNRLSFIVGGVRAVDINSLGVWSLGAPGSGVAVSFETGGDAGAIFTLDSGDTTIDEEALRFRTTNGSGAATTRIGITGQNNTALVSVLNANLYASQGIRIGADSGDNEIDDATQGSASTTLYIGNESIDTTASARIWKKNITEVNGAAREHLEGLSTILHEYDYRNGDGHFVGLVVDEVQRVFPQYVVGDNSLRYHYMVGDLLWGWSDQDSRISQLEKWKFSFEREQMQSLEDREKRIKDLED